MLVGATKPFAQFFAVCSYAGHNSKFRRSYSKRDSARPVRRDADAAVHSGEESPRNLIHNFRNLSYFMAVCGECATGRAISRLKNGHFVAPITISC
jgi:hypothetical protein